MMWKKRGWLVLPLLLVACKEGTPIDLAQAEQICKERLVKPHPGATLKPSKAGGIQESPRGFIWKDVIVTYTEDGKPVTEYQLCEVQGKTDTSRVVVEQVASPD